MAPANLAAETPTPEDRPPVSAVPSAEAIQAQLSQLPIGFGNPIALRVALILGMTVVLLEMIPGLNFLFLLWWLGAGWVSVVVYRRLTGAQLSVAAGARLGAMTGVLTFIATTLILALAMAAGGREFLDAMVKQNPETQQVVNDPAMLGGAFLLMLVMLFSFIVGACAAGGALSARALARRAGNQV